MIWSILESEGCAHSFVVGVCNLSICLNLQLLLIFQMASMAVEYFLPSALLEEFVNSPF